MITTHWPSCLPSKAVSLNIHRRRRQPLRQLNVCECHSIFQNTFSGNSSVCKLCIPKDAQEMRKSEIPKNPAAGQKPADPEHSPSTPGLCCAQGWTLPCSVPGVTCISLQNNTEEVKEPPGREGSAQIPPCTHKLCEFLFSFIQRGTNFALIASKPAFLLTEQKQTN